MVLGWSGVAGVAEWSSWREGAQFSMKDSAAVKGSSARSSSTV